MAAVSNIHAPGTLTPPRSPRSPVGTQRPWEHQAPIENDKKSITNANFEHIAEFQPHKPISSTNPKNTTALGSGYLQPSRVNTLGRKDSNISAQGSEGDSLLDMYGNTPASRSVASMDGPSATEVPKPEDMENASRWIHRDKLARIESRELREAGIHIGPQNRSSSRQLRPRSRSRERAVNGTLSPTPQSPHTPSNRVDPKITPNYDTPLADQRSDESPAIYDLRLPEEAAADPHEDGGRSTFYRSPSAKQSFSRIPLSTSSPIPVPQDYIARNLPLQRNGSNGWSGEDDQFGLSNRSRSRSHSIDSQVLLNEDPSNYSTSPGKSGPSPRTRKTSANRPPNPKPRSRSTTNRDGSYSSRPGTRSGETPPGSSSSRRPEGDPPWVAHSYAPDPRLPPDQQLLPTVAKRLKQEQWEREGKVGSVYDREFHPLALQPEYAGFGRAGSPSKATNGTIKPQIVETPEGQDQDWPLKSPKSPGSNGRPGTSGTDHGGYRTMPTISATPMAKDPLAGKTLQPIRVQEPADDDKADAKAKKGCCCIVM